MITSFMENGVFKSFGIFFVEYVKRFDSTASVTSLISGTFFGVYSISALLMMMVGLKYLSSRQSVVIGGLCTSLGYLLCAFATNIGYLIAAQGVLTGIGSAFTTGPSLIILGRYFDKRRGFANGVALAFGSIGGLVIPPLFQLLVNEYTLNGALLITSGLLLNIVVGAFLMRPIKTDEKTSNNTRDEIKDITTNSKAENEFSGEDKSLYDPLMTYPEGQVDVNDMLIDCDPNITMCSDSLASNNTRSKLYFKSSFSVSLSKLSTSSVPLNASARSIEITPGSVNNIHDTHNFSAGSGNDIKHARNCSEKHSVINRIQLFFKSIFSDLKIFKNPLYILFLSTFCLGAIGCAIAHVFIPPFANEMGMDTEQIAILTIVIGATDFLGRIVCSLVSDCKNIQRYHLIMVALFIVGITMQFAPLYRDFISFVILSGIFGAFGGIMITFYATVLVDFIGFDGFESGLGLMTSSQGIVVAIVTPFVGYLKDVSGTYRTSFHFMGTCILVAASLLFFVPFVKRNDRTRQSVSNSVQRHSNE